MGSRYMRGRVLRAAPDVADGLRPFIESLVLRLHDGLAGLRVA